ncbi:MHYT domain-containing protein [Nostoc sp. DedQUE07]|uniref:MHYT domain-containing protein n=1 Tax=unclassified Nostoc TaxID=2593658 RepID=UPI00391AFE6E
MHYNGMSAMKLEGTADYNLLFIIASILFALCASIIALWLAFRIKELQKINYPICLLN